MSEPPEAPDFDDPTPGEGPEDRDARLLTMFERWDGLLTNKWSGWQEQAKGWYDFADGRQWSDTDRDAMAESGKIPVVFNLVAPTLDAVSGAEISNRQQVQFFPREVGDTGVADALTQGAEFVSDECNGDMEDSEAFMDMLVCGMGVTDTKPDVDNEDVDIVKERVDPLQMKVDPSSRKKNFENLRYLKREMPMSADAFDDLKDALSKPDATGDDTGLHVGKRLTVVNPAQRYRNGLLGTENQDDVIVCEWQWYEREAVHLTALPHPTEPGATQTMPLTPEQHDEAQAIVQQAGREPLASQRTTRKVYYRALVGGGEVLEYEELTGGFSYKFMTGKFDRETGTPYGLVRPMIDPAMFTNKLYSEILHIVRTNANGGVMMEADAVENIKDFENTYAATDKITWLKPGALSNPNGSKMTAKSPPPVQPALFQLMEFAKDMVRGVTGVNEEILGLAGREQAGVLEYQRKQAAYGILSPYFDAARRYRREWGKLLLSLMRKYLPKDKLVRVVDKGTAQYVPLAETMEAAEYDVVVDDAPAGPNQKAKTSAVLQPLLQPLFEAGIIGADEIADAIPFMDLPASVADKLAEGIRKRAQAQSQGNPAQDELQRAAAQAEIDNKNADTASKHATAFKNVTDAHAKHVGMGADFLAAEQAAHAPPQGATPLPQEQA